MPIDAGHPDIRSTPAAPPGSRRHRPSPANMTTWILATLAAWIIPPCADSAADDAHGLEITALERGFIVENANLRVRIEDAVITDVVNLVTGEHHARAAGGRLNMPRGFSHLDAGAEQLQATYVPWHVSSMTHAGAPPQDPGPADRDYTPFFRPAADTVFALDAAGDWAVGSWRGLTNGSDHRADDELVVRVRHHPGHGGLRLRISGSSATPGVAGIQLPLANLTDCHRFVVPSFGGVMLDQSMPAGLKTFAGLQNFLEARVIAIEGRRGSLGLWAQDPAFHNHHLFLNWCGGRFSVAFDHQNLMPFEPHHRIESVEYHLAAFAGGWVDAMTPYRDWYAAEFADELATRAAVTWADDIRVIIDTFEPDDAAFEAIARRWPPATVMFHEWNARAAAFDTELPDWTPRDGYAGRVATLQALGFRTMAYVNTYCVNYDSPVFRRDGIAGFGLTRRMSIGDYTSRRPGLDQESQWHGMQPGQLLYLDPLSPRWRSYHAENMIEWHRVTGTDANYEDVLGTAADFGNGVIDGVFAGGGGREQVRELLRRNGAVPMASEYAPENVAFGTRWPLSYLTVWGTPENRSFWTGRVRPVSAFIHGPGLRPWVPILRSQDEARRHRVAAWSDGLGGLAQLSGHPVELAATRGNTAMLHERARLFSELALEPHFEPAMQPADTVALYRDRDGGVYRYRIDGPLQELLDPRGEPLYQRVHGARGIRSPLQLRGWPARDGDRWLGLDPADFYSLLPKQAPHDTAVTVSTLPDDVFVRSYREGPAAALLVLEPRPDGDGPPAGRGRLVLAADAAFTGLTVNDRPEPGFAARDPDEALEIETGFPARLVFSREGAAVDTGPGAIGDLQPPGTHVSPDSGIDLGAPFQPRDRRQWPVPLTAADGGPGQEPFMRTSSLDQVVIDHLIRVPDEPMMLLFHLKNAQDEHGNGVIARLLLNGRQVRAYDFGAIANPARDDALTDAPRNLWPPRRVHRWAVSLDGFEPGQELLLTMATDSKHSTNADNFWWSRPILVPAGAVDPGFVVLTADGNDVEGDEDPSRVLPSNFRMTEGRAHTPSGY